MTNRIVTSSLLCFLLFGSSSCFQKIYQRTAVDHPDSLALVRSITSKDDLILHAHGGTFLLANPVLQMDTLTGRVLALPDEYQLYVKAGDFKEKYRCKQAERAIKKLHLYISNSVTEGHDAKLALSSFQRMDSYEFNKKATRNTSIFGTAGVLAVTTLLILFAHAAANYNTML